MTKYTIILFLLITANCVRNERNPFHSVRGEFDLLFSVSNNELTCKDVIRNTIFRVNIADTNYLYAELDSSVETHMKLLRKNERDIIFQKGIYFKIDSDIKVLDMIPVIKTIGEQGGGERKQLVIVDSQMFYVDFDMYLIRGDYQNERGIIKGRPIITFFADSFHVIYGLKQFACDLQANHEIELLHDDSIYNSTYTFKKVRDWYNAAITVIPDSSTTFGKLSLFSRLYNTENDCFYRLLKAETNDE